MEKQPFFKPEMDPSKMPHEPEAVKDSATPEKAPKPEAPKSNEVKKSFGKKIIEAAKKHYKSRELPPDSQQDQLPKKVDSKQDSEKKEDKKVEHPANSSQPEEENLNSEPSKQETIIVAAERVRRFARIVIEFAKSEVRKEPERSHKMHDKPADTKPLIEATESLDSAEQNLSSAIDDKQKANSAPGSPDLQPALVEAKPMLATESTPDTAAGDYDLPQPEAASPALPQPALTERISMRITELERKSEVQTHAIILTMMLGAIAIVATGAEFNERRQSVSKLKKKVKKQEVRIDAQEKRLAFLQQETKSNLANKEKTTERQHYYDDLSERLKQQTQITKEITTELQTQGVVKSTTHREQIGLRQGIDSHRFASPDIKNKAEQIKPTNNRLTARGPEIINQSSNNKSYSYANHGGSGASNLPKPLTKAPLAPVVQRKLVERQKKAVLQAAPYWLYGVLLMAGLVTIILVAVYIF